MSAGLPQGQTASPGRGHSTRRLTPLPAAWQMAWAAAVLVAVAACIGPFAPRLLATLVPAQHSAFTALMPQFKVVAFALEQRGAHLKLRATLSNDRYLVISGRALEPGQSFDGETPARAGLVYAGLLLAGAALFGSASRRIALRATAASLLLATALVLFVPPLMLAGLLWGLAVNAFETFTAEAVLVAAADFIAHGGGYALTLACLVGLVAWSRRV